MAPNKTEASTDATMPWITKKLAFVREGKRGMDGKRVGAKGARAQGCKKREPSAANAQAVCSAPARAAAQKTLQGRYCPPLAPPACAPGCARHCPGRRRLAHCPGGARLYTAAVHHPVDKCRNKPARPRPHWLCRHCPKKRQQNNAPLLPRQAGSWRRENPFFAPSTIAACAGCTSVASPFDA